MSGTVKTVGMHIAFARASDNVSLLTCIKRTWRFEDPQGPQTLRLNIFIRSFWRLASTHRLLLLRLISKTHESAWSSLKSDVPRVCLILRTVWTCDVAHYTLIAITLANGVGHRFFSQGVDCPICGAFILFSIPCRSTTVLDPGLCHRLCGTPPCELSS